MLLEMTRTIRKVNINEIEFTLQSLKSSEAREAFIEVSKLNSTIETTFEIRRQFLARSIVSVAETNINEFLASNSFEDKLAFIDQLDEAFLSRLYEEYMLLVEECKSKYLIKNDQDAKEVVEDLKK